MLWIKLTSALDDSAIWLNMAVAHCIEKRQGDTEILMANSRVPVREIPDVIFTKIAAAASPHAEG